ncbi:MAG: SOS response-associated peptidase [Sphingobacteriaceae bacterium]|nr:MAG: SOS response-associated peptidase [Sphingobacteriaceae bacterium]
MCTKVVAVDIRALSEKLKAPIAQLGTTGKSLPAENAPGDVLPTDLAPVITHDHPREIRYLRWGLVPAWTQDTARITPMFNAKAETLDQLVSFRDLVMTRRCLILNEGFYENEKQGEERVQWKVSPVGEDYFYKAGLWTTWQNAASGQLIESFTMITCAPGEGRFGHIHDRMPVMMNKAERRLWMNPNANKEQLLKLLKPCSEEMYLISEYSRKPLREAKQKVEKPAANLLF